MRRSLGVIILGALLVGGYFVARPATPRAPAPTQAETASAVPATPTTAATTDPGPAAAEVARDPRAPRITSEADLDRYLEELESAARARGTVDDELARGTVATRQAGAILGAEHASLKFRDFGDRLHRLRRQQQIAPTLAQLDSLAAQLRDEKDPAARARLTNAYVAATNELPPVERIGALDRLKRLQS